MFQKTKTNNEKVFTFLIILAGSTMLGLAAGFALMATSTLYFLAATVCGIGVGLLAGIYTVNEKK